LLAQARGKRAGERDAAGEAERQLAGKMTAMSVQFQNAEQGRKRSFIDERCGKPDIFLDRALGQ
jgi:hypothetical protein